MITALFFTVSLLNANFPLCTDTTGQYYPEITFANNQFNVFWCDLRYYSTQGNYALMGSRVSQTGSVLDPEGKTLFIGQNGYECKAAYDGTNFLVVLRDSC